MRYGAFLLLLLFLLTTAFPPVSGAQPSVPVTGVKLDQASLTLNRGSTLTLTATISPVDATDQAVRWISSDARVVQVTPGSGLSAEIKGIGPGTATVTVITEDGDKRASAKVEVVVPVERVRLNLYEATLAPGEEMQFQAWVEPDEATDQRLLWESSNNAVAYVDEKGLTTARSTGQARIIARSAENSTLFAYCTLTVADVAGQPPDAQNADAETLEPKADETTGDTGEEELPGGDYKGRENKEMESAMPPGREGLSGLLTVVLGAAALLIVLLVVFILVKKKSSG